MHQEFWKTLVETVSATSEVETEPSTNTSTDPSGSSSPQVLRTHHQHTADYMKVMMESSMDLTMGEDRAVLLITKVAYLLCLLHNLHQLPNPSLISYTLDLMPSSHFPLGLTEDLIS